jgi:transposase
VARLKPWEVSDELWTVIEPQLPKHQRRARWPGRKRLDDRLALQGILFALHTGIAWEHLPQELGYGSGMTCWRRLNEWHKAGVWQRLHEVLLARLRAADALDFSRAAVDSSHIRALKDIPGASTSSGGFVVVRPGGDLAVEGAGFEASVQDADEPVGDLAQCRSMTDAAGAGLLDETASD